MTPTDLGDALAVLGLPLGADLAAARAARRGLLKRWHPDRFPAGSPEWAEATRQSQRINEAFAVVERAHAQGVGPPPGSDPREWPYHPSASPGLAPRDFRDLAWRLRAGERALDLRNEIVARERIPMVTAARRVENVQRALRAARAGLWGGTLVLLAGAAFAWTKTIGPVGLAYWTLLALVQIVPAGLTLLAARPPEDP